MKEVMLRIPGLARGMNFKAGKQLWHFPALWSWVNYATSSEPRFPHPQSRNNNTCVVYKISLRRLIRCIENKNWLAFIYLLILCKGKVWNSAVWYTKGDRSSQTPKHTLPLLTAEWADFQQSGTHSEILKGEHALWERPHDGLLP